MKVSPENILLDLNQNISKNNFFLISGNEETLTKEIERYFLEKLNNLGFTKVTRKKGVVLCFETLNEDSGNLFDEKKILVFDSPKDVVFEDLKSVSMVDVAVIIYYPGLKNTSKIKKFCDSSPNFISTSCYKLSRDNKKRYLDFFIKKNNMTLDSGAYWYILDNSSDLYKLFESELIKINNYNKKNISIEELKKLIAYQNNGDIDKLFFMVLNNNKEIFIHASISIKSSSDSYLLLQRAKFYFELLSKSQNIGDAEMMLPKYLFKEKPKFLSIFKKINYSKASKINKIMQKTELLLRKHDSMYLSISQRFLANIKSSLS